MRRFCYDSPEAVEFCLRCQSPRCNGRCDAFKKAFSERRRSDKDSNFHRDGKKYLYNGELKTVAQWAEIIGITRNTLYVHLRNGESMASIVDRFSGSKKLSAAPCVALEQIDETRRRLDAMRGDREFFDRTPDYQDSSTGMVANYGKMQSAPTNRISSIVEDMAIAEARMSDEMLLRREWLRCAERVLQGYAHGENAQLMGFLMDRKVFHGWTARRIQEAWEADTDERLSYNRIYYMYSKIVHDVAAEALARGLFADCASVSSRE